MFLAISYISRSRVVMIKKSIIDTWRPRNCPLVPGVSPHWASLWTGCLFGCINLLPKKQRLTNIAGLIVITFFVAPLVFLLHNHTVFLVAFSPDVWLVVLPVVHGDRVAICVLPPATLEFVIQPWNVRKIACDTVNYTTALNEYEKSEFVQSYWKWWT